MQARRSRTVPHAEERHPAPEIPKDRFDIASLKLTAGTQITEVRGVGQNIRSRRYRSGEDSQLPQALLDTLAEELKKEGFSSPKDTEE
jgi:hypothetical protein